MIRDSAGPAAKFFTGRNLFTEVARRCLDRPVNLAFPANHFEVYLSQLKYLERHQIRPLHLIFPLNIRNFGPSIFISPASQARLHRAMMDTELYLPPRLGQVLQFRYWRVAQAEVYELPVIVDGRRVCTIGDIKLKKKMPRELAAYSYLAAYAPDPKKSPRMKVLKEILQILKNAKYSSSIYLVPIDLELAERYLSRDEIGLIHQNLEMVRAILTASGVPFADLSGALAHESFQHLPPPPQEHYKWTGIQELGRQLCGYLEESVPHLVSTPSE